MHLEAHKSFSTYLRSQLVERCEKNPHYSMRALARDLKTSVSIVSEVLNGKRNPSSTFQSRIAELFRLSPREVLHLSYLAQAEYGRTEQVRRWAKAQMALSREAQNYDELSEETFVILKDWYYYATLELTLTEKGLRDDCRILARRLGITRSEAWLALERLQKHGLLKKDKNGLLLKTSKHITTKADQASAAIREFNRQVLTLAHGALDRQDLKSRDFSTITMAIDPRKISAAKERIKVFRREMCDFLESGKRNRIYCLSLQLFALDEISEK